jgi:hypothetical protein
MVFRSLLVLLVVIPCVAQRPVIFDVSTVAVGPQRLETVWAFAEGKWSDERAGAALNSTAIHCYKRFGFCEMAHAMTSGGVDLGTFDILRWDEKELLAVDSSPICVVNTLRFDLATRQVSITGASKGKTDNKICTSITPAMLATAFLAGGEKTK